MSANETPSVIPAQLSFLTIYNPSLGTTDETLAEQIVFYTSRTTQSRRTRSARRDGTASDQKDDKNERLRQVGLAQGMVSFAKDFSKGKPVDSVETEKSRIVLHELEPNWWILASIDLTRLPSNAPSPPRGESAPDRVEYSSREIAPPQLIIQQLLRANSIFLLHHASTLQVFYDNTPRATFCRILDQFWTRFILSWNVLLNGNPVVDIFNGIKLATGGELGIGVGEEEWGSGEREVLEDFVSRTDGLEDLVVSRFGEPPVDTTSSKKADKSGSPKTEDQSWIGSDNCPRPSDGVIFAGVGAMSRPSLTQVSLWMEWIYRYGEDAYGVRDDPWSSRRRKRRKEKSSRSGRDTLQVPKREARQQRSSSLGQTPTNSPPPPGIPPPLVTASETQHQTPASNPESRDSSRSARQSSSAAEDKSADSSAFGTENFMKYLTLGYGSAWGNTTKMTPAHPRVSILRQTDKSSSDDGGGGDTKSTTTDSTPETSSGEQEDILQHRDETIGRFIIGLRDDLEDEDTDDEEFEDEHDQNAASRSKLNKKILRRTLEIKPPEPATDYDDPDNRERPQSTKLQVIIYLHQPFMFTFLFKPDTPTLSQPSFYRSIHHQLGPLQKPLLSSTSPSNVAQRISVLEDSSHNRKDNTSQSQPLYDIIYNPSTHTVHSSLPNIPDPISPTIPTLKPNQISPWSRVEALNVHTQLLNTYIDTHLHPSELERTCKTSRGWWVVWLRLPSAQKPPLTNATPKEQPTKPYTFNEAFLVRRASDYNTSSSHARSTSGTRFFRDITSGFGSSSSQTIAGNSPRKIAEGVGLDPRKYVEGLLNLNR
ncbi:hypothetical protein FQN54_009554 [Arachnomyces sp. PD_36]|nr:hypothetical protein FQN54_009554 [Arachnomyces sp. PD_36]